MDAVKSAVIGIADRMAKVREDVQALIIAGGGTTYWNRVDATGDVTFENTVKGNEVAAVDTATVGYDAGSIVAPLLRNMNTYFSGLSVSGLDAYAVAHRFRMHQSAASLYNNAMSRKPLPASVFPRQAQTLATYAMGAASANVFSPTAGIETTTYGPTAVEVLVNSVAAPGGVIAITLNQVATPTTTKQIAMTLAGAAVGSKFQIAQGVLSPTGVGSNTIPVNTTAMFTLNDPVLVKEGALAEIGKIISIAANTMLYLASPMEEPFTVSGKVYPLFHKVVTISPISGVVSGDYFTVRPYEDRTVAY
jgi:hypothetical protein